MHEQKIMASDVVASQVELTVSSTNKLNNYCKNCDSKLFKSKQTFCSRDCLSEYRRKNHVRTCKNCGRTPEETEFGSQPSTIDGLKTICKSCDSDRVSAEYKNYSDDRKRTLSMRHKNDLDRNTALLRNFGITLHTYNYFLEEQEQSCGICKTTFDQQLVPHVDHDHTTLKVRGLLCRTCNSGLGMFKDDINKLGHAITYLKRTSDSNHINSVIEMLARREGEERLDTRRMRKIAPIAKSKEGRLRLLESQDLKCACCEDDLSHRNFLKINIDHDHAGMFIRGALCKHCNVGLGLFYEEEARFTAAISYLVKHSSGELAA